MESSAVLAFGLAALLLVGVVAFLARFVRSLGRAGSGGPSPGRKRKDKSKVIKHARMLMENPEAFVVVDTETTGLGKKDEIIEIAVVRGDGKVLLNQRVRPERRRKIPEEATGKHGITMEDLLGAPNWKKVLPQLLQLIEGKRILAWNSEYDSRMVLQTCEKYGFAIDSIPTRWTCLMKMGSQYIGEWYVRDGSYKYQGLRGGDHSALGDSLAALEALKRMASGKDL